MPDFAFLVFNPRREALPKGVPSLMMIGPYYRGEEPVSRPGVLRDVQGAILKKSRIPDENLAPWCYFGAGPKWALPRLCLRIASEVQILSRLYN